MSRRKFFTLLSAILVTPLLWAAPNGTPQQPDKPFIMTLKGPGQKTLHIEHLPNGLRVKEYPGKAILFNFFGKHCPWCWKEIPHLVELQKKYKGKLQIIAIQAQRHMTPQERKEMYQRFGFDYPVYEYEDGDNALFVDYISRRTNWQGGLPFSVLFDAKGNYVYAFRGYAPLDQLERAVDFAITGKMKK